MKKTSNKNDLREIIVSNPIATSAIIVSVVMCVAMFFYNYKLAIAELLLVSLFLVIAFLMKGVEFKKLRGVVNALEREISVDDGELRSFPLPVLLFDNTEKIVWYNALFRNQFITDHKVDKINIRQFTSGQGLDVIRENMYIECEYGDKKYTVFSGNTEYKNEVVYALYFVEDTELKNYRTSYNESRPVVLFISIDGIEESLRKLV